MATQHGSASMMNVSLHLTAGTKITLMPRTNIIRIECGEGDTQTNFTLHTPEREPTLELINVLLQHIPDAEE